MVGALATGALHLLGEHRYTHAERVSLGLAATLELHHRQRGKALHGIGEDFG